jgi:hypothetical protein
MNNTIILKKGYARLTENEYRKFEKGDTIWGDGSNPEEVKRWSIDQKEEAEVELAKYRCAYKGGNNIEEWALEYCECDEDGEFVEGSDFSLAEENTKDRYDTREYETGAWIDSFDSVEEARAAIQKYEEDNRKNGTYEEDSYEIYDTEECKIVD